jgi:phospho-N-acetylmuramoyl-pentapeptide-transferase
MSIGRELLLALGLSFGVTVVLSPFIIPVLAYLKAGQSIREDGPRSHLKKSGTPTMGGIIMVTAIYLAVILVMPKNVHAWMALFVLLAIGAIGFGDDYIKVVKKRSLGLRALQKIGLQIAVGALFAFTITQFLDKDTTVYIPFLLHPVDLGWLYIPFEIVVVLATANAVNLTDGLDGLAAGVTVIAALAMGYLAYLQLNAGLTVFSAALAGTCLGFLVFNRYPAKVFMGDTGSMALGGGLCAIAIMTGTEFYFLIIGGVYVLETVSDIIQVVSFKLTGKRIFRMAPLHHHYELGGWPEKKVVRFFYGLALIFAAAGILAAWITMRGVA